MVVTTPTVLSLIDRVMSRVEEITDVFALSGYRLLWNALLPQTRGARFFQSLDWLETWWRHFGRAQALRVLVACSAGRPIGILPLCVRTESTRIGPVRVLAYAADPWPGASAPVGPNPTATLAAGMHHLRQARRGWDMIDLRGVDRDGVDRGRTEAAMRRAGFAARRSPWRLGAAVQTDGNWKRYLADRRPGWLQALRDSHRRLSGLGKVEYLRYRPRGAACGDGDPRWDLLETCVALTSGEHEVPSVGPRLGDTATAAFFREVHEAAARAGGLDLNLLLLDRRPVAFSYNCHRGGRVDVVQLGRQPDETGCDARAVMMYRMLKDSFRRGDRCIDLSRVAPQSIGDWPTSVSTSCRLSHFPLSVSRVQLLRVKHWYDSRAARARVARPESA
jgi:CelD/BcsL family acetyltransferase involved in cellulose biosynthesis